MDQPRESSGSKADGELQTPPSPPAPGFELPPPSFAERAHVVFLGTDGLRSGWRLVLYLAMGMAVLSILEGVVDHIHGLLRLWSLFYDKVALLVAVLAPAFVMARVEQRPFGHYGLPRRGLFGRRFWLGALWGMIAITVLLLVLRGAHAFYFGGLALHGLRILKFAGFWGVFFLLVGLSEEFLLRGYSQFTLTQGIGFWPAAVLLSIAFGAIHLGNQGETWNGLLGAAVIGLFFCLTLRRTGDLWFAVGFHTFWNWGETFLYSVPNSGLLVPGQLLKSSLAGPAWLTGGSVGPEGSLLVFVLVVVLWVVFDRMYPEAKYPARH